MLRKMVLCVYCFLALILQSNGYVSYLEGTDITHRNVRSTGPRRKQIREELLTMLGIPSLWKSSSSREVRNLEASRERRHRISNPENSADSVFMLDIYNRLTDSDMGTEMELSSLSKPALTLRKIRKSGKNEVKGSQTSLSNLRRATDELTSSADKMVAIRLMNSPNPNSNQHETILKFSVPENDETDLTVATLRIFKKSADVGLSKNLGNKTLTLVVQERIQSQIGLQPNDVSKLELKASVSGWLELDITSPIKAWMNDFKSNNGLIIKILDYRGDPYPLLQSGISGGEHDSALAPFVVLYHDNENFELQSIEVETQRQKRAAKKEENKDYDEDYDSDGESDESDSDKDDSDSSARTSRRKSTRSTKSKGSRKKKSRNKKDKRNKGKGKKKNITHCSRDRMYLNFRELGWDSYIIAPEGYAAFRCRGECNLPLSPQVNATNHAIVQALIANLSPTLKIPKPCCAPQKLEQMTVVYHDEDNRVILRKYKEMVVRSCGCH